VHDGRKVIDTEVLLDELAQELLHARRVRERRVQIVQHEHINPALTVRVRPHVRLDRRAAWHRDDRWDHGKVDERERRNRLRPPVFDQFEIGLRKVGHDLPVFTGDDGIHFDVIDVGSKGDGGRLLRWRRRALSS
jgi:hypothetical protein